MRTPEQVTADAALTKAVEGVVEAYQLVPSQGGGLLTGYVIFTMHQGLEVDGQGNARYNWICMEDGMPWHSILGLIDMGQAILAKEREDSLRRDEEDGQGD